MNAPNIYDFPRIRADRLFPGDVLFYGGKGIGMVVGFTRAEKRADEIEVMILRTDGERTLIRTTFGCHSLPYVFRPERKDT